MTATVIDMRAVQAIDDALPDDQPFFMVNLLRFREHADYGGDPAFAPCSGQEAYFTRYIPAFAEVNQATGGADISPIWIGAVSGLVVAPTDEVWHMIAIVSYPSFAAFRKISESAKYAEIAERHRLAALEDLRLIATTKFEMPG